MQTFLLTFTALFSVVNPLGTVPLFLGLSKGKSKSEIQKIAIWTSINTLIILLVSFWLGQYILTFFGISLNALKLTGGLIMASSGFALLTGNFTKHKGMKKREKDDAFNRENVSLTPLALPMLSGPGTISLLISYQMEWKEIEHQIAVMLAIFGVCLTVLMILTGAKFIHRVLGASGMTGLSRIIGFVVIAIGIEYILGVLTVLF